MIQHLGSFQITSLTLTRSNQGVLDSIVPFLAPGLFNTAVDWNFTTTPQAGLLNRPIGFTRGHVLGGSSSISEFLLTDPFCRLDV